MTTVVEKHESGLDIYWLPESEPVEMNLEIISEEEYKGLRSYPVAILVPLVNRPFEEVLAEKHSFVAISEGAAEAILQENWWFGPFVIIGSYLVASTPENRVICSKKDPDLQVLQLRADINGDFGVCKLV